MIPVTKYSSEYEETKLSPGVDVKSPEFTYVPKANSGFIFSGGAQNFDQLISDISSAEDRLKTAGYQSVYDRIHVLRGIFYGTSWSVDFFVENSEVRNTMFQAYTSSSAPDDPRAILGQTLFQRIFNSAEVYDGNNKAIDFGHLIIGMDARLRLLSREFPYPKHGGGSGLEICTWLGDLGGGAGMLSIKRALNPRHRALSMFKGSSFGGWVNLEGDIGGFLCASNPNELDRTPSIFLESGGSLADALAEYLAPNSQFWNSRARRFMLMLGAEMGEGSCEIINIDTIKQRIASKIEGFAELYMFNRLRQQNRLDIDVLIDASSHLAGASREMTDILFHLLGRSCEDNSLPIKAHGIDPDPTPAGFPYFKYLAMKGAQKVRDGVYDWVESIEEWFQNW